MILESLLNKNFVRACAAAGVVALSYAGGYYSRTHLDEGIEKIKSGVSQKAIEIITPEEHIRRNMPLYTKEITRFPEKYKSQVVDISIVGLSEYPIDIFVKGTKNSLGHIKEKYDSIK